MFAYDRHFSNPVIGGTGHAQCNIWSYSTGIKEHTHCYDDRAKILSHRTPV